MEANENNEQIDLMYRPLTGTIFAVAGGLSFFFLCMSLSLVGPAGSRVPHAAQNRATFLAVLFLTLLLAGLATWSKMGLRRVKGGPLPWLSIGLCGICFLTLIVLLFNGFAI